MTHTAWTKDKLDVTNQGHQHTHALIKINGQLRWAKMP